MSREELTQRERIYVECRLSGMTQKASAAAAGSNDGKNTDYEHKPRVREELVKRMNKVSEEVDFGRREAHDMLFASYTNADTAMEQIAAVREMIKLHGLAEPAKVQINKNYTAKISFEQMDIKQLMHLAELEDFTLEGEFEAVPERVQIAVKDDNDRDAKN